MSTKSTIKNKIRSQQVERVPIYDQDRAELLGTFTGDVAWVGSFGQAIIGSGTIVSDTAIDHRKLTVDESAHGGTVFCLVLSD